jgi:hypothetical protein
MRVDDRHDRVVAHGAGVTRVCVARCVIVT